MPRQRSNQGTRRDQGGSSSSSSRAQVQKSSSSSAPLMAPPSSDLSSHPRYGKTRYMSPWCPPLRTKAWLAFHGLPSHLWTERTCMSAVADFGGAARITRIEDVPRRIEADQIVGFGHLLTWPVDVEILAYAPVGEDDETAPPGALIMMASNPEERPYAVEEEAGKLRRAIFPAPKPEECVGILDGGVEASGAVERPESSSVFAFTDD
ncbi:hypothetical protein EJB05_22792, partial [Eragrostis curvula]